MDWYGCWGCQHCLTVCPNGAISVLGKSRKTVFRYR
ncbi:MAG: 4Fe-4S binding protein [Eubacterium ramulus]